MHNKQKCIIKQQQQQQIVDNNFNYSAIHEKINTTNDNITISLCDFVYAYNTDDHSWMTKIIFTSNDCHSSLSNGMAIQCNWINDCAFKILMKCNPKQSFFLVIF